MKLKNYDKLFVRCSIKRIPDSFVFDVARDEHKQFAFAIHTSKRDYLTANQFYDWFTTNINLFKLRIILRAIVSFKKINKIVPTKCSNNILIFSTN